MEIWRLHLAGLSEDEIAKQVKIHKSAVSQLKLREFLVEIEAIKEKPIPKKIVLWPDRIPRDEA